MFDLQWWNLLVRRRLPANVRRLTLEKRYQVSLLTIGNRHGQNAAECGAPELHNLEHLVLRGPQVQIESLNAFGARLPQRLTLQAKSSINVRGGCAGEVVHQARQLIASGHRLELCCPTRDCIRSSPEDWNPSEAMKWQENEHLEELRCWFVETAAAPEPEWCSRRSAPIVLVNGTSFAETLPQST